MRDARKPSLPILRGTAVTGDHLRAIAGEISRSTNRTILSGNNQRKAHCLYGKGKVQRSPKSLASL